MYEFVDFEHYMNCTGDVKSILSTIPPILKEIGIFVITISLYFATSVFPL